MNKTFNKNNLTNEQQQRWDWAVLKYREIREKNTINSFEELNEKERLQLMQELTKAKDFNGALTIEILDEKSALFARLLDGKKPFIFPPPCAYSYPWYEVIEDTGPWSLSVEANQLEELLWENLNGEAQVLIEQTPWKIVSKNSNTELVVTFGKWEELGFEWILRKTPKSCVQTKSFIYCHHKSNISRITTYEDLKNEQQYQVLKEFEKIKLIIDQDYQATYKSYLLEKYGNNSVTESILEAELQIGHELLNDRKSLGLTNYPSQLEIETLVNKKIQDYFDSGYKQDKEGNLFVDVWVLEKSKGVVDTSIYMKI